MGHHSHSHNKDYYNLAGRTPGPRGPLHQFKDKLSKERAVLRRSEEHRLPSEVRRTGEERTEPAGGAGGGARRE
ncbi:MAG TPA: hypothetical protein DFS52_10100 [Myxococcales bacterium]|jgi:hypothetical protein|nr:hypothetical protein [Myxococcales bacterium]